MRHFSPSTRILSILFPLLFFVPAIVGGFVDDVRLGEFSGGEQQLQSIVDWEGVGAEVVLIPDANIADATEVIPLTSTPNTTTIQGDSLTITADFTPDPTTGSDDSISWGMEIGRTAFLAGDPTKLTVFWDRSGATSVPSAITLIWAVCTEATFTECRLNGFLDSYIFVNDLGLWSTFGNATMAITIGDQASITNMVDIPVGGSEWIFIAFADNTIADMESVTMDAQILGPVPPFNLSLDTYGVFLVIWGLFMLALSVFALEIVSFESVTKRRGGRRRTSSHRRR